MAYIHQYSKKGDKKLLRHMAVLVAIGVFFAVFMSTTSKNFLEEWKTIAIISGFIIILFMFISYKTNPLGWIKLLFKKRFAQISFMTGKVNSVLENLDDRCFSFTWLIMEFFQIDHFVISPYGIFIIANAKTGDFSVSEHNELLLSGKSFDKTAGKLWRVCNMINILFKKGFKKDHMPTPVIVVVDDSKSKVKDYKGIQIVSLSKLDAFISDRKECIDEKVVKGFSWFIIERYIMKEVSVPQPKKKVSEAVTK